MKARLTLFSDDRKNSIYIFCLLYFGSFFIKFLLFPLMPPTYDEAAYSITAKTIVDENLWLNIYNSSDLFFFPPLFNWFSALLILLGFEQIVAVRVVSMLFSSGIPVLIFLLMRQSDISLRRSLFAAILWILFPSSIYYGAIGQVETSFIFFLLASFFYIGKERRDFKNLLLSALFFSLSCWIKETALGFIPVFMLLLFEKREGKNCFKWLIFMTIFCLPLFIQSFLPHKYDLFFELKNGAIDWGTVSLSEVFENVLILVGFYELNSKINFVLSIILAVAVAILIAAALKKREKFVVRLSLYSLLIFIPFFAVFPKKFEYYLLPPLLFLLILLLSVLPKQKFLWVLTAVFLTASSCHGLKLRQRDWAFFNGTLDLLLQINEDFPTAKIGTSTPHFALYAAKKMDLKVQIRYLDRYNLGECESREDRCVLDFDYFLATDDFFSFLFCKKWPIKRELCDLNSMKNTLKKLKRVKKSGGTTLYKKISEAEPVDKFQ